jgi:hypothetical protein
MIEVTNNDIGRVVIYRPLDAEPERGVITSFNERFVFVRYGEETQSKATPRRDLEYAP